MKGKFVKSLIAASILVCAASPAFATGGKQGPPADQQQQTESTDSAELLDRIKAIFE